MTTKKVRMKPLEPPFEPQVEEALHQRMPRTSAVTPLALFRLLVRDDALSSAMMSMGRFNLGYEPGRLTSVAPHDREVIIQRVCLRCGCEYEWGVHVAAFASAVGLPHSQAEALACVPLQAEVPPRELLLAHFVDKLHDSAGVDDELWEQLREHWSEQAILQMLMLVGWYHGISYIANVARLPPESGRQDGLLEVARSWLLESPCSASAGRSR